MRNTLSTVLVLAVSLTVLPSPAAGDATPEEAQKLVVESGQTLDNFVADPNLTWFRDHAKTPRDS